ncbi:MAG TPA: aldo/keto reductase [Thermoplasmata archaeon]|nr:aldo/keto reductase [Thermoplasmata archaeon]
MQGILSARRPLNSGGGIPALGFGTWQLRDGEEASKATGLALDAGYRLLDTASLYGNERGVGRAVRESGIQREEVFVTTKVWNTDHGHKKTLRAFEESNSRLGLDYVDLYLIHWPVQKLRGETWEALIELNRAGKAKSVGVSNYTVKHLKELLASSKIVPSVNQVEFSPFLFQRELMEFCKSKGIVLEAYSPLVRGEKLGDPRLSAIAARHRRTPAQIILRWNLQHGLVPIPKAADAGHIRENAAIFDFELSAEEMGALDSMDEGHRECWDPSELE